MGLFSRSKDQGSGTLDDYAYDLRPRRATTTMRLAGSDPYQAELDEVMSLSEGGLTTMTPARTAAEDGADAPIEIKLFLGRRVSGVVGTVPRGLEAVYDEVVRRLEDRGDRPRIPVEIVRTKAGLRVDLLMGRAR